MSLDTDLLIDRRNLRRKLSIWRLVAILLVAVLAIGAWLAFSGRVPVGALQNRGDHIARIKINGLIADQTDNLALFDTLADSDAKAVIVEINSPGGTTTGGEALYGGLRKLSGKRPTVAVIDGLGASAAYMAAIGTDHIVTSRSSLVGSIGVLIQYPNVTELLDKVGVRLEEIKSSPLKAAPNGMTPTSEEARAAMASVVADTYDWFKGLVKERRGFDDKALAVVADGRVFTGKQALDLKLVDEVGNEATAIAWLAKAKSVDATLPVREWKKPSSGYGLPLARAALAWGADMVGAPDFAAYLRSPATASRAELDGLVSVWHP